MLLQRRKRRFHCWTAWGVVLIIGMAVCILVFQLDYNSTNGSINQYQSLQNLPAQYLVCDNNLCPTLFYQSGDQVSCCNGLGFCQDKYTCINQHLDDLSKITYRDQFIVLIVSILAGIFLVVGLCLYLKQAAIIKRQTRQNRVRNQAPRQDNRQQAGNKNKGKKEKKEVFIESFSYNDLENTCCICLQSFSGQQKAALMPCGHLYHSKCIRDWKSVSEQCPICRAK